MKSKVVSVILVVLMFFPTAASVIHYVKQQGGSVSNKNAVSMTLTDPAGNKYEFGRGDEGDTSGTSAEMLNFFVEMNTAAEEISALPSTVPADKYYSAEISTTVKKTAYKYYFTLSAEDCYLMDGDGKLYQIKEADAKKFLSGGFAGYLYENGLPAALTVAGEKLAPKTSSWSFTGPDGEYVNAVTVTSEEIRSFSLEGGLTHDFSVAPDRLGVKITEKASGKVLFDDTFENFPELQTEKGTELRVELNAKWYEDASRNYYGEQTYLFDAVISEAAMFYAGVNTVQTGEFICVTAVNVSAPDKVAFSSQPDIGCKPVFVADGDYAYAYVPFSASLAAGQYTLSFEYGGVTRNLNITLQARSNPIRNKEMSAPAAIVKAYYNDEVIKKANEELMPVASEASSERYFEGSFLTGCQGGVISTGFGHNIKLSGTDLSYTHTGVDYTAPAGTKVQAINAGKVVYSGYLDHTGYIVVIEHGYGLKSWYAHMSKTAVEKGTVVKKGDVIGECGSSGFAFDNGVHVGLTVFSTPVCQYTLWDDGINKGIPVYTPEK